MGDQNNKNLILAMVLSMLVIMAWMLLFPPPEPVVDPNAPRWPASPRPSFPQPPTSPRRPTLLPWRQCPTPRA